MQSKYFFAKFWLIAHFTQLSSLLFISTMADLFAAIYKKGYFFHPPFPSLETYRYLQKKISGCFAVFKMNINWRQLVTVLLKNFNRLKEARPFITSMPRSYSTCNHGVARTFLVATFWKFKAHHFYRAW